MVAGPLKAPCTSAFAIADRSLASTPWAVECSALAADIAPAETAPGPALALAMNALDSPGTDRAAPWKAPLPAPSAPRVPRVARFAAAPAIPAASPAIALAAVAADDVASVTDPDKAPGASCTARPAAGPTPATGAGRRLRQNLSEPARDLAAPANPSLNRLRLTWTDNRRLPAPGFDRGSEPF